MATSPKIVTELQRIARRNDGCLKPEDVVLAASNEDSPLHSWFDWEDTEAAHKWRIHQARQLIRVAVAYIKPDGKSGNPTRVFVSLRKDRGKDKASYREMVTVLSDPDKRSQLLADALAEMQVFQEKYAGLKELVGIFSAIKKTMRRIKSKAA